MKCLGKNIKINNENFVHINIPQHYNPIEHNSVLSISTPIISKNLIQLKSEQHSTLTSFFRTTARLQNEIL